MKFYSQTTPVIIAFVFLFQTMGNAQTTEEKMKDACLVVPIYEKTNAPQKALTIKASATMDEMANKMGALYGKIMAYMSQNKIEASGAPFAVYYKYNPEGLTEFEAAIPINKKVESNGDVVFKEFPSAKVLSAIHVGPYDKLHLVYGEIQKYADKKAIQLTGIVWEIYKTDPSVETDADKLLTQVYFQIKQD